MRLLQLAAVIVVLTVWQVAVAVRVVNRELLPPPLEVLRDAAGLAVSAELWLAVGSTLQGASAGLGLAVVAGVPLGLIIGASSIVERTTRLLVDLGRSFPVIALLPVMILILGASTQMKITVVFLACVWPILLQSVYGARRIEPLIAETARSYRIPRLLWFRRVILPSAGPYIGTGIRIAAAGAVLVSVAVEVLSQTPGLGQQIALSQQGGSIALSMAYVIYSGLLGLLLNGLLAAAEGRLLGWHRRGGTSEGV